MAITAIEKIVLSHIQMAEESTPRNRTIDKKTNPRKNYQEKQELLISHIKKCIKKKIPS